MKILTTKEMEKMTFEDLDEYATDFMLWAVDYEHTIGLYLEEKQK